MSLLSGAAGASAGAVEAFVNCPFETVKVQMQAKENLNRFKVRQRLASPARACGCARCTCFSLCSFPLHLCPQTTTDCLRYIVKEEGPLMLYRGIEAHVWRNMAWNGTYFACIGTIRNFFPAAPDDTKRQLGEAGWEAGGTASCVAVSGTGDYAAPSHPPCCAH